MLKAKIKMLGAMLQATGRGLGGSMKLAGVTEFMTKHPKAIGEELGNLLGGKKKQVVNIANSLGVFDKLMGKLNEVAHQYPEAVINYGVKCSKRGFTVLKAEVKNGNENILKGMFSFSKKDGKTEIKTHGKLFNSEGNLSGDITEQTGEISFNGGSQSLRFSGKGSKKTGAGTLNIGKRGEIGSISTSKSSTKSVKFNFEHDENLIQASATTNGRNIDVVIDKAELQKLKKANSKSSSDNKPAELSISILRDLKDRFADTLRFFGFHKRDLGLVTKTEAQKCKDILIKDFEKVANSLTSQKMYPTYKVSEIERKLERFREQIDQTKQLIEIMV